MIGRQYLSSELELRAHNELESYFIEGLKGYIATHYSFNFNGEHVVADDGELVVDMMERAGSEVDLLCREDSFYTQFLPARYKHEFAELAEQEAMCRNDSRHTALFSISPWSEEYFDHTQPNKLIRAHQKPYFKRSMLRISVWDGSKLHIFTRSLDGSSVELLRNVSRDVLGYEFSATTSTDMLGERVRLNAGIDEVEAVIADFIRVYDSRLVDLNGGSYIQGRVQETDTDIAHFMRENAYLTASLVSRLKVIARRSKSYKEFESQFNDEVFGHLSLAEKIITGQTTNHLADLDTALSSARSQASAEGSVFDVCGHIISADKHSTVAYMNGFESLTLIARRKLRCPKCNVDVRPDQDAIKDDVLQCPHCDHTVSVCGSKSMEMYHRGRARKRRKNISAHRAVRAESASSFDVLAGFRS
jgi:hypothetical protein